MSHATLKISQGLHSKLKAKAKKEGRVLQAMVETKLGELLADDPIQKLMEMSPEKRKAFIEIFNRPITPRRSV